MKIQVRSPETNLNIVLPTGLVLNGLTARILPKVLAQNGIQLRSEDAVRFVKALNQYRRSHPEWVLVDVDSASGEKVYIKLGPTEKT